MNIYSNHQDPLIMVDKLWQLNYVDTLVVEALNWWLEAVRNNK